MQEQALGTRHQAPGDGLQTISGTLDSFVEVVIGGLRIAYTAGRITLLVKDALVVIDPAGMFKARVAITRNQDGPRPRFEQRPFAAPRSQDPASDLVVTGQADYRQAFNNFSDLLQLDKDYAGTSTTDR